MALDLVIVGAGPAGLATAIFARRRGLSAIVLEKRRLPLDKACGEGLMPAGVAALAEMGVELPAWGRAPFAGIRYLDGDLEAKARFRSGRGLGVRRTVLTHGLLARARELGVELRFETEVLQARWRGRNGEPGVVVRTRRGALEGRWLVAADGLHSRLRREAGLERPRRTRPPLGLPRRFGVRRHFEIAPWSELVEVHWGPRVEAYVTPIGPKCVGVALLWSGGGQRFEELLARFPKLERRLAGAHTASRVLGAGPFEQRVRRLVRDRLALVGDAAGYLDPLTGEGLSLGFRSARALVDVIARGEPLANYQRACRHIRRSYTWTTRLLLEIGARPRLRRRVISMLRREPEIFERLLAISAGEAPLASLGPGGARSLLRGLLAQMS